MDALNRKEAIIMGDDITPVTREEAILKGDDIAPITRSETVLKKLSEGGEGELPLSTTTLTINVVRGSYVGTAYFVVDTPTYMPDYNPPRVLCDGFQTLASNKSSATLHRNVLFPCTCRISARDSSVMKSVLSNAVNCTATDLTVTVMEENPSITVTFNAPN